MDLDTFHATAEWKAFEVKRTHRLLSLLDNAAAQLVEELLDEAQGSFDQIVAKLRSVYCDDPVQAWEHFTSKKFDPYSESVDAYVAQLKRWLATALGLKLNQLQPYEEVLKMQFVQAVPKDDPARRFIVMKCHPQTPLQDMINEARGLYRDVYLRERTGMAAGTIAKKSLGGSVDKKSSTDGPQCWICKGVGHTRWQCPERKSKKKAGDKSGESSGSSSMAQSKSA